MSSDIPGARARLKEIAAAMKVAGMTGTAEAIEKVVDEKMTRQPAKRRARPQRRKITRELRDQIAEFARLHPGWTLDDIGNHFYVAGGRVSEVINGKHDDL